MGIIGIDANNVSSMVPTLKLSPEASPIKLRAEPPIIDLQSVPSIPLTVESITNNNFGLIEALKDLPIFFAEFQPLPSNMLDKNPDGVRSIAGKHPSLPGRIVWLSGLFLAKSKNTDEDAIELTIEPPDPSVETYEILKMGSMCVYNDGSVWSKRNDEPFGAYSEEALLNKVYQTMKYGVDYGVLIEGYGSHSKNPDLGWLVYSTPDNLLTPLELFWININTGLEQSLYGDALYSLAGEMRHLHEDLGITHGQVHPGNWMIIVGDRGDLDIVLKDWSTVQQINNLPAVPAQAEIDAKKLVQPKNIRILFEDLTPEQTARALDLYVALEQAVGMSTAGGGILASSMFDMYIRELGVKGPKQDRVEMTMFEFRLLAIAMAGYLGVPKSFDPTQAIEELTKRYMYAARQMIKRSGMPGDNSFSSLEGLYETEAVTYAGDMAINEMRSTLIADIVIDMVENPKQVREQLFVL